jgi:hypothetical protein
MGLLIHSHRHHFGSTAANDFAALLSIVEGDTYRGVTLIDAGTGWVGVLDGRDEFGGDTYTRAELLAEIDDYADEIEADVACCECDGTGQAYGPRGLSGYARWGDCPCCDGTGVRGE